PLQLLADEPKDVPDVKVWDVATGRELRSWSLPGKGPGLALSPDGETVAVSFGDTGARIYPILVIGGGWEEAAGESVGGARGVVRLYQVPTGAEVAVLKGHTQPPWGVAFSPDGRRIVTSGGTEETIKLWDAATGEEIMTIGRHPGLVTSVTFSPDGLKIVSTT